MSQKPISEMTRGEKVCAFIEAFCLVPEGDLVGQPLILEPFQREFILDVFDNPHGTRLGILSTARKNAKSTTIAAIGLACLLGPEAVYNSQIIVGARSREQAGIIFKAASKMIDLNQELKMISHVVPSTKRIIGEAMNVELRVISAEAGTAHGLSPRIAILDEMGQIRGPKDDFVDAITSSQGAYDDAVLFAISTQAADDGDMFSIWIDDALTSKDKHTVCHLHTAPADCELDDEEAWKLANPAIGKFRSKKDIEVQCAKAMRLPSEEAKFRQLYLNQRVEAQSPYVSKTVWMEGARDIAPLGDRPIWYGLDLSASDALTALVGVAYDEDNPDVADIFPTLWVPGEGIQERSKLERVPYDLWVKDGHIVATPGFSVDYDWVAYRLVEKFKTENIVAVNFDRWNIKTFQSALERQGATPEMLEKMRPFGQGYSSMSPAIRSLDDLLLNARLRHPNNPAMNYCMMSATVKLDPAGNRKLDKSHRNKRIDGAVALVMAVGATRTENSENFDPMAMIA
jgi:phage terminase large subunit-like protein